MTKQFRQITFLGIVLISLLNLAPAAAQELSGIIVSSDPDLSRALVIHDSAVSVRRIGASIADSDPRTIIEITRR